MTQRISARDGWAALVATLLAAALLAVLTPQFTPAYAPVPQAQTATHPVEVMIRLHDGTTVPQGIAAARRAGAEDVRDLRGAGTTSGIGAVATADVLHRLEADPAVASLRPAR
jgi:hypothetical protein